MHFHSSMTSTVEVDRCNAVGETPAAGTCQAYALKSSLPMSMRRISEVPAPISYNLASRRSRPVYHKMLISSSTPQQFHADCQGLHIPVGYSLM